METQETEEVTPLRRSRRAKKQQLPAHYSRLFYGEQPKEIRKRGLVLKRVKKQVVFPETVS